VAEFSLTLEVAEPGSFEATLSEITLSLPDLAPNLLTAAGLAIPATLFLS